MFNRIPSLLSTGAVCTLVFFCAHTAPVRLFAESGTGLNLSAAVDVVGQAGFRENSGAKDRLDIREAEFMLYAPTDHLFDGMVSFAAHREKGQSILELHEATIGSTKLIPRSRFKIGQFFLGVGRLNQVHRHDWPFISAPLVQATFFDEEGIFDSGVEFGYLFPTPFYLDLTAGITNGWVFGHAHSEGKRPLFPTHYLRLATYTSLFGNGGVQLGLNYLGRRADEGAWTRLVGIDQTAKWRQGKTLIALIQSEFWYQFTNPPMGTSDRSFGLYVFPQANLFGDVFAGVRFDYLNYITQIDSLGNNNLSFGVVPTISIAPSEFTTFRFGYHTQKDLLPEDTSRVVHYLEAQAVFILGAHPVHEF